MRLRQPFSARLEQPGVHSEQSQDYQTRNAKHHHGSCDADKIEYLVH